jgi:hypothetical protein
VFAGLCKESGDAEALGEIARKAKAEQAGGV